MNFSEDSFDIGDKSSDDDSNGTGRNRRGVVTGRGAINGRGTAAGRGAATCRGIVMGRGVVVGRGTAVGRTSAIDTGTGRAAIGGCC